MIIEDHSNQNQEYSVLNQNEFVKLEETNERLKSAHSNEDRGEEATGETSFIHFQSANNVNKLEEKNSSQDNGSDQLIIV